MSAVNIAEAKARLSELVDESLAGETVTLMRRGKPVALIVPIETSRKPIDLAELQALTAGMTYQEESAGDFMRRLRDEARY